MAKTQIKNYVFKPGIGSNDNLYPNAYSLLSTNKLFIQKEATAWIQDQIDAGTVGFVGYTYNVAKCERDVGFVLDAYLFDLRYGGNEKLRNTIQYYWDQGVAQIDGDRQPEIQTHTFIGTLIADFILANVAYNASNNEITQTIDLTKTAETEAITKIATLVSNTVNVITTGLSAMPAAIPSGIGTIKIQGRYDLEDILLITNTTINEIIYNFSNPATGGSVEFKTDGVSNDDDFPFYLQTTDAITTLTLNYNTSSQSSTDELQIFVERVENGKSITTTRPFDFGTDAIERMRIAQPLSMLDADFEYGLQPTKWAAIGTLRGYPSVYEIPGTDTPVFSVVTDASSGTSGVGQSLITVTTVGPHGFNPGTPITIKALEDSVVGAARAEGSFVINTVPSTISFTYFAKSKVGTNDGDVLSTTYTQLRQAGFYTGASIGRTSITVQSNGFSGSLISELDVPSGETRIPFDGPSPEIGAPLVDTTNNRLPLGTQVAGVIDQSSGGGVFITPQVAGDYPPGTNEISVVDPTGIVLNLAADSGDLTATYINNINSDILTFSSPFTNGIVGNTTVYANISGTNDTSFGDGAVFNISRAGGTYTVDAIVDGGQDYEIGDRLFISGAALGGRSPDHDLVLIVDSLVDTDNAIESVIVEGTAFDGTFTFTGLTPDVIGGTGTGARFDVEYADNVFTNVLISAVGTNTAGSGYIINDRLIVRGSAFTPNGVNDTNDLIIVVTGVDGSGAITSFTSSGTAPNGFASYVNPTFTYGGAGTGAAFTVTRSGIVYSVSFTLNGSGYVPTETITIAGTELGGSSPANDLTITIDNVGGSGEIIAFSLSGVASNQGSNLSVNSENLIGTGLTIDVELAAGAYSVTITSGGDDYGAGQQILIPGTELIGETPTNDLNITINTVDAQTGAVLTISQSGTAASGTGSYTNVDPGIQPAIGTGASFDITRNNSAYSVALNLAGNGYKVGNRIVISGTQLGGISPLNDLTLRVSSESSGQISGIISDYEIAASGINLDLFCTILTTEPSTGLISTGSTITYEALATLEIAFENAHGLVPGDTFIVTVDSDNGVNGHRFAAGSFFATEIPTINSLRYTARAAGTINTNGGADPISSIVYPRPDSFFIHRPYDGGVQLGTGGPQHGAQAIRQSKKYIRYQSGKGIMYTTGALFAPSYDLRSVTANSVEVNSLITVVTDDNDHGVQVGGIIRLLGIETPGYNSGPETAVPPQFDYEVVNVIDERTFQVRSQRRLGNTTAVLGFGAQMSVVRWHGATVRSGIFDDQNGIFWEFDGTQISVVQRTGTRQLAGTIAMTVDTNLVTGTNTKFRDQLKAGDRIIIKGMTHVVSHVNSQTELTVTPDWRGVVDISGAKANLIVDKKVKQQDFNLDRLDGTGPSGYNIDIAKMQMIGIQYSWYGAGFIDFMLRGADGNFVFAHRMRNSNVNTEAFMRSGNLPVRYEVTNEGPSGKLASSMTDNQTSMILEDTSFFPDSGVVYIDNEIISFSGNNKDTNTLTGLIRSATFTNFQAGATRTYTAGAAATHDSRTGVVLISQTITPLISHWGSAFITDGMFDEDRGYIFSYAATEIPVSTIKNTSFLIRLAPSVSNAIVGDLGERELLNRAQLLLQELEVTSNGEDGTGNKIQGGIVIEGVLNPINYPFNPGSISWSALGSRAQGGQPSFAQIAPGGSVDWGQTTQTANAVVSADIDTGFVYTPSNGTQENFSPIEFSNVEYNLRGPVLPGSLIFGGDGAGPGADNVYTNGGQGDYLVTTVSGTNVNFRSTTGQTRRANNWPNSNTLVRFVYRTYTGRTSRLLFSKASWETAGATIGTPVATVDTKFPAGTAVSNVRLLQLGSTEFYEVEFNQTSSAEISPGDSITFEFGTPGFALPGETVFSFIAVPGERATVDFSTLKELTNTPLGGRGTFPNGPDVLAINVFKVSGAATTANIILKWGEAQA